MNHCPPEILPVVDSARPLWSVMIPTYNCAAYLRRTLASVLADSPEPKDVQIEVVDDCSTRDDPEAIVREFLPEGRVAFYRQPANVGVSANFNTCIARARGHLVHILHGDDLVLPGFHATIAETAARLPEIALFATRALIIDAEDSPQELSPPDRSLETPGRNPGDLFYANPLRSPAMVLRRSFYERHGGFLPTLRYTADWEMWVRGVTRGGGVMIDRVLASYRLFPGNDTSRLAASGENMRDMQRLGEVFAHDHPDFDPLRFRRELSSVTHQQAELFRAHRNREAHLANLRFWREITPFTERVPVTTRTLLRSLRRRLPFI